MRTRYPRPLLLSMLAGLAATACDTESPSRAEIEGLAADLLRLCPAASLSDESARDACASGIASSPAIRERFGETILWGGHDPAQHPTVDPDSKHLTRFDSFVFLRLYLSTFSFTGEPTIESRDGFTVLRMPVEFRNQMNAGAYPYPFWHVREKWDAYQMATEVLFLFEGARIVAAYRAGDDAARATEDRGTFDGMWRWFDEADEEQPHVALYSYLLSPSNPYLADLDSSYRALESELRDNTCVVCHAPDNVAEMRQLVMLTYPNQALGSRHDLLEVLADNSMPPDMPLDGETLAELARLAEEFARQGDLALEHEASIR